MATTKASGTPKQPGMFPKQPNGGFKDDPSSGIAGAPSPTGGGVGVNFGLKVGNKATPVQRTSPYGGNSAPA